MEAKTKQCQRCDTEFTLTQRELDFLTKVKDVEPEFCYPCRFRQRLAFWSFGKFHKRKCDLTGEKIISIYSENARFPVYETSAWHSDAWAPPELDYDPDRSFMDQLFELQGVAPRPHQFGNKNVSSDYADDCWESKNAYLCRSLGWCENLSYCFRTLKCRDSYDLFYCFDADQSYDCVYCFKIFNVHHSLDTKDSMDSAFLYDCRNVKNCFMSWNLRNKQYYIRNKQYSKEEYEQRIKAMDLGSWQVREDLKKEFIEHLENDALHRQDLNHKSVASEGNYLSECKECVNAAFFEESENCTNVFRGLRDKDCQDCCGILQGQMLYDVSQDSDSYGLKHSSYCINCRDSEYMDYCQDCTSCFGCVGLKKKKFCILNKQYTEEKYKKIVEEIKADMMKRGEYGKFLPYKMTYIGYNISLANQYFPLPKEEILALGGYWEDLEEANTEGLNVYTQPDNIEDVADSVLAKALVCTDSGRAFNVTKDELTFYRKNNIPLPRQYPDVRTLKRVTLVADIFPSQRQCATCQKEITAYRPQRYKRIACIECYQKEII